MVKRIIKFALFSAVAFGIGWLLKALLPSLQTDFWVALEGAEGALGGLALGLVSKRRGKALADVVILGGIGFSAGILLGYQVASSLKLTSVDQYFIFYGLFTGAFGGMGLGLALWGWKRAIVLALAGAVGFSVLPVIMYVWFPAMSFGRGSITGDIKSFSLGFVGGAILGAAAGYLEKR